MSPMRPADLVVLGLGPAGRAVAHRAANAGMQVRAYDPAPDARWRRTFGMWSDEVPAWLPDEVVAARSLPEVHAGTRRALGRDYVMLDVDRFQDALLLDGVDVRTGRAGRDGHGTAFVVDARGPASADSLRAARQTAAGVVVAAGSWPELWMDWRAAPGVTDEAPASFLYAVRLSADSLLLEETSLAALPGVSVDELEARLRRRLAARSVDGGPLYERVDFPLLSHARKRGRQWCGVGVRGTTMHPATGYSLAGSLSFADQAITALSNRRDPLTGGDIAAHTLRAGALRALLGMRPHEQRRFFEAFFALPDRHVRAFLSARSGPMATASAMAAAFAIAPAGLRRRLAAGVSRPWNH